MAFTGLLKLFIGKPVHPVGDDGRMALSDHLRELRARILKAGFAVLAAFIVGLFFFDPLFDLVWEPYRSAQDSLPEAPASALARVRPPASCSTSSCVGSPG